MNAATVLQAPWRSTHASLRWLTLAMYFCACLGAVAAGVFMSKPSWWLVSTAVYCFGVGYGWAFWMSTLLLLAIDAKQLRLPNVQRAAARGVLLYGLLALMLPVVVLGALGVDTRVVALLVALAMAGGLAFVWLPRWCSMVFCFAPAISEGLQHHAGLPLWSDPRWLQCGVLALAVLMAVDVLRWHQLLRADSTQKTGLSSAMLMQFRRHGALGHWGGLHQLDSGLAIRLRPDWMQPRANVRTVGPHSPVAALQVALGGAYLPQTWAGYLRQLAILLLSILFAVLVLVLISIGNKDHEGIYAMLRGVGLAMVIMFGAFGGMLLTATVITMLRQRWQRMNAELPLLALLPGLGSASTLRRQLLRAAFTKPLLAQALLLVCMLMGCAAMHFNDMAMILLTLAQLVASGMMVAVVVGTFGGCQLPNWGLIVAFIAAFTLLGPSAFIPLFSLGKEPWRWTTSIETCLTLAWVVLAAATLWLGRRGWQGLQARPHPFLAN